MLRQLLQHVIFVPPAVNYLLHATIDIFEINNCTLCGFNIVGTHVYLKYQAGTEDRWSGEVHFPTALLDSESIQKLEAVSKSVHDFAFGISFEVEHYLFYYVTIEHGNYGKA